MEVDKFQREVLEQFKETRKEVAQVQRKSDATASRVTELEYETRSMKDRQDKLEAEMKQLPTLVAGEIRRTLHGYGWVVLMFLLTITVGVIVGLIGDVV